MNESFLGIKLAVSPLIPETAPRMQLSPDVMVTDTFRAEMNAWLLEFFGETTPFIVMQGGRAVITNPANLSWLKQEISNRGNTL